MRGPKILLKAHYCMQNGEQRKQQQKKKTKKNKPHSHHKHNKDDKCDNVDDSDDMSKTTGAGKHKAKHTKANTRGIDSITRDVRK